MKFNKPRAKNKIWTPEEITILKEYYPKIGCRKCAAMLNIYHKIVEHQAKLLGLKAPQKWDEENILFLEINYEILGAKKCAKHLGVSEQSVRWKARQLGFRKCRKWTKSEIQFLIENYPYYGIAYCAKQKGIDKKIVKAKIDRLGIKKYNDLPIAPEGYRTCTVCRKIKLLEAFANDNHSGTKYHKRADCKICNSLKSKNYAKKNYKKVRERSRIYERKNRDKINAVARKNYLKPERKQKLKEYNNIPLVKLKRNLRIRVNNAIKRNRNKAIKSNSTIELIGCSWTDVEKHLESQFKPNMTWDNHARNGWHIDHIRPCDSFDLSIPEEQNKCFHWTNLRPMWATDRIAVAQGDPEGRGNLNKGHKWDPISPPASSSPHPSSPIQQIPQSQPQIAPSTDSPEQCIL